jgi:hypothetical protein
VVVKGKEHEANANAEQAAVDSYGGKLIFSSGEMRFSSIDLLKQEMAEPNLSSIVRPMDFLRRHGFTMADLLRLEMLEHLKCGKLIEEHADEDRTTKLIGTLASVKLQCRKHMRNIMANMGPSLNAQSMPVIIPEGLSVADLDELDMEPDEILS